MKSDARLREDALACLKAAVGSVEPGKLVAGHLGAHPEDLGSGPVWVAAFGKAGAAMAAGAREALGDRIAGGVLVVPAEAPEAGPAGLQVFRGGHPVPDEEGVRGARAILELAERLGPDDRLLCLISGGGSALLTLPPQEVPLADVQEVTGRLLRAGASIRELNTVRKHLDRLKGGRLAAAAAPAEVVALVLSDVVGDPLEVIASGPVSADPTTFADAVEVLRRFGLWEELPASARRHLSAGLRGEAAESPGPEDPCFRRVRAQVVGNNRRSAEAALDEAWRRGYRPMLLSTLLTGEAREVGRVLGAIGLEVRRSRQPLGPPACLVAAGETTVTVTGRGKGGRNQELALGAALVLDGAEGVLLASLGTDGVDGPTDAAGAFADGRTLQRARALGLDPAKTLRDNDAYPFFAALGDLVVTGPTGTNVMDLQLVLIG
jgi:glycerate 2-kinase